jgi:hypothetical protein
VLCIDAFTHFHGNQRVVAQRCGRVSGILIPG